MDIEQYYNLGFAEAKRRDEFFKAVSTHINHAREKHPFFANAVGATSDYEYLAKSFKYALKTEPSLENVFLGEVCEFMIEAKKGNYERAYEEACDIVAVLFRYLAGDMTEK